MDKELRSTAHRHNDQNTASGCIQPCAAKALVPECTPGFQSKVTDNKSAIAADTVQVTVNTGNTPPAANAGSDQSITLPINSVSLNGKGTDTDGSIATYKMDRSFKGHTVSGSAVNTNTAATSSIRAWLKCIRFFRLKVTKMRNCATGGWGGTIQITVNAANILPSAKAGNDQAIALPTNTVSLSGSGTDTDGSISTPTMCQRNIRSPVSGAITNTASAATTVTALIQGVYRFQLKVTDNKSATAADTVQVTVNAANIRPTAKAGNDQTIGLPVSITSLAGARVDQDGAIANYNWTKLSGPALHYSESGISCYRCFQIWFREFTSLN